MEEAANHATGSWFIKIEGSDSDSIPVWFLSFFPQDMGKAYALMFSINF